MAIEFHCSKCNRLIRAPDEAGGKRGKCPYCHESVYVPLPPDSIEPIPLAPLDTEAERKAQRLTAEMVRSMAALDHEDKLPPEGARPSAGSKGPLPRSGEHQESPASGERIDVPNLVLDFVRTMRESQLVEADRIVVDLRADRAKAKAEVQRLLVDEIPPPGLEHIPLPLVKGFLKTLLQRL